MSHPRQRQRYHSGPLPSCFRPPNPIADADHGRQQQLPPLPPTASTTTANLATSLYHTSLGIFTISWSRNLLAGRSLRLHLIPNHVSTIPSPHTNNNKTNHRSLSFPSPSTKSPPSFHLTLKPFIFWNKNGHKKLPISSSSSTTATLFWDFTHAKFGSGSPEPESGYYIAVISPDGDIALLLGDMDRHALAKITKRTVDNPSPTGQSLVVVRREQRAQHKATTKLHRTKAQIAGRTRELSVECDEGSADPRLVIKVDHHKALLVRHLKWKFRGSERVEVDGCPIRISWDVHNWLFEGTHNPTTTANTTTAGIDDDGRGFAVFTFRFEDNPHHNHTTTTTTTTTDAVREERVFWSGDLTALGGGGGGKRRSSKRNTKARSSSASSMSSASSSGCGSVLDWESVEETELKAGPAAFSLVVYA